MFHIYIYIYIPTIKHGIFSDFISSDYSLKRQFKFTSIIVNLILSETLFLEIKFFSFHSCLLHYISVMY